MRSSDLGALMIMSETVKCSISMMSSRCGNGWTAQKTRLNDAFKSPLKKA